jgi:hypothetical protein
VRSMRQGASGAKEVEGGVMAGIVAGRLCNTAVIRAISHERDS